MDSSASDGAGITLGHSGCSCDVGSAPARGFGLESALGLLGAMLVWRRARKRR
jgi:MYXO-CTERM domain-containing protein